MITEFLIKWWELIVIGFLIADIIVQKTSWKGDDDILAMIKNAIKCIFTIKPGQLPMLFIGLFFLIPSLAFAASNVTFEWDANIESDLAGYRIYQSDTSGIYVYGEGSPNLVATLGRGPNPGGKEEITILIEDGTHYWVVTAFDDEVPSLESGPSNELTKKISSPPAPPQGFWIKLIQIIIAWIKGLFGSSSFRFA